MKKQLSEHIEENDILVDEPPGLRSNHSCETELNLVLSECLDQKRAFETEDTNILLTKLQKIAINDTEDKWTSYLSDRQLVVSDTVTTEINVNMGLPQGTELPVIKKSVINC